jgi:uncharacterized membrane protein
MKETRTINLNGMVYHIDYDAYQALRDYIQDIELRLPMNDRQEIIADIEARIAELFQNALFAKNIQVVDLSIVENVKAQIGAPSEFGENSRPKVKTDKSQNTGCRRIAGILVSVILGILALPVIFIGMIILFAIILSLFGVAVAGTTSAAAVLPVFSAVAEILVDGGAMLIPLLIISLIAIVVLPIVMIVYAIVTKLRTRRGPKPRFWWITILLWITSIVFWCSALVKLYHSYDNAPEILKTMIWEEMDINDEGVTSSTLQLDSYHSIILTGAAELHLSNAEQASTMLRTNLVQLMMDKANIKAQVRDSVLYIDVPGNLPREAVADFTIAVPELRKISIYGASKIETMDEQTLSQQNLTLDLNGAAEADLKLAVKNLNIEAKGASKLELEGRAENVEITIAGAGKVDADDLVTQNMRINCAGASQAEIHVVRELWAQAAGASRISYQGNPTIKQKMAVGGSFILKD